MKSVLGVVLLAASAFGGERPNVVLFIADDVSPDDLGCYGNPVLETPAIDRLAAEGLRFENAYLSISSCSPSRCSLITGRYPHNTGAPELHTNLPAGQILWPEVMRESGYYTVLSGKHHMGREVNSAFDVVSKGGGPGAERDWVKLVRERPREQPFFFWFASSDAHRSWKVSEEVREYEPEEVIVPPYLVDGPKTRSDFAGYYHEVSRFDHFVGVVVDELERQEVLGETVVIVMADNGRPFPRSKTRLYDSGIKTPFVVRYPARVPVSVTQSLISSIDVSATILDLAGLDQPLEIQGVSFRPVLEDSEAVTRDVVFAEHNWHVFRNHERMVRTGEWLYIKNSIPEQRVLCLEDLRFPAAQELWAAEEAGTLRARQRGLFRRPAPTEELYLVSSDPHQLENLAGDPANGDTLSRMRGLLDTWVEQTGDTLPSEPTPDREQRPGGKAPVGKHRHKEMPGDARGAQQIHHPGPVKLGAATEPSPGSGEQSAVIDVINWNTYHLFDHMAQLKAATAWLAEQAPDLLALQEVLHIKEEGLVDLAKGWGHDHAVMHKERGYPVALTSSEPIEVVERRVKGLHHGYLHARTHGIDVFVVHFWPTKVGEARAISKLAAALVEEGKPVLVMGDFNGKIRFDEAYLLEHGFGEEKEGEVTFDYRLTDAFLDKGFVELVSQHSPDDLYTFGAPALIPRWAKTLDEVVSRRRRIDFLFVSPDLAATATSASVHTDDSREGLYSDHYPLRCALTAPARK